MSDNDEICERVRSRYSGKFGIQSIESNRSGLKIRHNKYLDEETRKAIENLVSSDIRIEFIWII